jgi:hypothetical protein
MGQAFITDTQMPHSYWYWTLHQAVQVLNDIPCTVDGISMTPHELFFSVKPDFCPFLKLIHCIKVYKRVIISKTWQSATPPCASCPEQRGKRITRWKP